MAESTGYAANTLVQNFGLTPAVNFHFMLRVEGLVDLPCKTVRAFQQENEYELIQEGGLNDYVHMRRKPISKPFTIQVERYIGVDILDPLPLGSDMVLPLVLYVNRYQVYGSFYPVRMYLFTGCTVMSKEYGELNAEKSGLMTEVTTIAYREMICMENVAGSYIKGDTWKFDGTTREGKGDRHAVNNRGDEKAVKPAFQLSAKKWEFNGTTKEGKGDRRAVNNRGDEKAVKPAFQSNARKWTSENGETYAAQWKKPSDEEATAAESGKREFNGTIKKGTGERNAEISQGDENAVKTIFQSKAKKWTFEDGKPQAVQQKKQLKKTEMEARAAKWVYKKESGSEQSEALTPEEQVKKAALQFKGENGQAVRSANQMLKLQMEKKAQKWTFEDGKPQAVQPKEQLKKSAMAARAKKWPPKRNAVDVAEFLSKNNKQEEK